MAESEKKNMSDNLVMPWQNIGFNLPLKLSLMDSMTAQSYLQTKRREIEAGLLVYIQNKYVNKKIDSIVINFCEDAAEIEMSTIDFLNSEFNKTFPILSVFCSFVGTTAYVLGFNYKKPNELRERIMEILKELQFKVSLEYISGGNTKFTYKSDIIGKEFYDITDFELPFPFRLIKTVSKVQGWGF